MNPHGYQGHRWAHQESKYFPSYRYETRMWDPPAGVGVYLFIKFPIYETEFAAQSVVLGKKGITPRGRFVGIARKLRGASYDAYKYEFARPFADLVLEYSGQPFVVQSVGCESLRRHHVDRNTIASVHLFRDEIDIKRMMNDPRFAQLKRKQMAMATDVTAVFTIDSEACP
ncbi:hypothetical protein PoB_005058900 [Plakobranchus ocellatus]|uniref:Uncharacterized protein n=1 Tax=Plakobranchus ocellatus TaxID=259542 RepID=A0AAV4BZ13_9GAST|nr:hypothetical protein PoB_005058900 [Plakobranchus ocellatus]